MTRLAGRLTTGDISVDDAQRLRKDVEHSSTLRLDGEDHELSEGARQIIVDVLDRLSQGESVLVVSADEMLSTQEAANILRVSRPTLVKMLEDGIIPFEQPGTHRRVSRRAIQEFLDGRAERRARALDAMADTEDPADTSDYVTTR